MLESSACDGRLREQAAALSASDIASTKTIHLMPPLFSLHHFHMRWCVRFDSCCYSGSEWFKEEQGTDPSSLS